MATWKSGRELRNDWKDNLEIQDLHFELNRRAAWMGLAFKLEVLILLLFLVISITVLISLFVEAHNQSDKAAQTSYALELATTSADNCAEAFAAQPNTLGTTTFYYNLINGKLQPTDESDPRAFAVTRVVTASAQDAGTMYNAAITVTREDALLYSLNTTHYVSGDFTAKSLSSNGSSSNGTGAAGEEITDNKTPLASGATDNALAPSASVLEVSPTATPTTKQGGDR